MFPSAGVGGRTRGGAETHQEGEGVGDCQDEGSAGKSKGLQSRAGPHKNRQLSTMKEVVQAKF